MKTVTLKKDHEHAGVIRPAGQPFDVEDHSAAWLEKQGLITSIKNATAAAPKPAAEEGDK